MTVDLTTRYLGLELASPLVASASPLTGDIETLLALQEAGIAAAVLPSLFEEQIVHDALAVADVADFGADFSPEFSGGHLPEMLQYNTGSESYLNVLRLAKRQLRIPVIGSLNGVSPGGWVAYAERIEHAGADALELNIYQVAADAARSGSVVEAEHLAMVESVRKSVAIPLAVKVGPFYSSFAEFAARLAAAGADGLVLFNRFYQPDVDLGALDVRPNLLLSTSTELRLPLTWIGILHGRLDVSLAATTGVHSADDVVKVLLVGGDVAMSASALLRHGPGHVRTMRRELLAWLSANGYDAVEQMKGSLSQQASPDPSAFERANYMKALVTFVPQ
jgi:dihydroorotate dehydrogenase (fumarate)